MFWRARISNRIIFANFVDMFAVEQHEAWRKGGRNTPR